MGENSVRHLPLFSLFYVEVARKQQFTFLAIDLEDFSLVPLK